MKDQQFLILLILLITVSIHDAHPCKWLGSGPFCGKSDCPSGQFMVTRNKFKPEGVLAYWGTYDCTMSGIKTLCCDNGFTGQP